MMLFGLMVPRAAIGPSAAGSEVCRDVVGLEVAEEVGGEVAGEVGAADLVAEGRGFGVAATAFPVGVTAGGGLGRGGVVRCCTPTATARPPTPSTPTPAMPASEILIHEARRRRRNARLRAEPEEPAIPCWSRARIPLRSGAWAS